MSIIIDRRLSGKSKSTENREKFKERHDKVIREAVRDIAESHSIKDIENSKELSLPIDEEEYGIFADQDNLDRVFTGNKKYRKGDTIPKDAGGKGQGGDGDDEFKFVLTKEEFEKYLFEELEIPNLEKKQSQELEEYQYKHAGFKNEGTPAQLSISRSIKKAMARVVSLEAGIDEEIEKLNQKINLIKLTGNEKENIENKKIINKLKLEIEELKEMRGKIPFLDEVDLRYRFRNKHPLPTTKAVMICLMDVSGSMDEDRKSLAKRFYLLLYLFLKKRYDKFEIVFIRHTETAELCDEDEFFYGRKSGGTFITEALKKVNDLITKKYSINEYNIYLAHASDGEALDVHDVNSSGYILNELLLPLLNMYIFIGTNLSHYAYYYDLLIDKTLKNHPKVFSANVEDYEDVITEFMKVFKRKGG
jgi:uncharacterized sporulation protein YeaH/YhbH (DUF444 family)